MTFRLGFFTNISNCNLKCIQGFVCFYCQKMILFQNLPGALEYPERMISENVCRFNLTSPSLDIFVVRVVTCSLGGYLMGCFDVSHITACLFIKNVLLLCYH